MNTKTYALSYSVVKYLNDREPTHRALDQSEVGYLAAELCEAIKEGNSNEVVGYITSLNEEIELSFKHKLNETDAEKLYLLIDVRQQLIDAICQQVCEFCRYAKDTGNGNYKCWLTQYNNEVIRSVTSMKAVKKLIAQ